MNAMVLDTAGQPHWPVIDSADYTNGSFVLQRDTQLIEPAWACGIFYIDSVTKKKTNLIFNNKYFSTKKNPSLFGGFILENTAIKVEGEVKNKFGLSLTGAKETDFDFQYGLMQPPAQLSFIEEKMDSVRETTDTLTLASFRSQRENLLQKYKDNFKKIINSHPSYFQALFNVYQNANYFTVAELQRFTEVFDKKLLELPTGKKLITFIKNENKLLPGKVFPEFIYMDTTGEKISLADVKGSKGTLIVFWASWCGPCREEIPELKKLYHVYHSKGISIVSISCDNDSKSWKKALQQEQMLWPNLSNLPGYYGDIFSKYNIKAIPLMFLLDGESNIISEPKSIEQVKEQLERKKL